MFERFTDRARRAVTLAAEEARRLNHNWIGTEHILLGLLREGGGVAAEALESLGISLQAVRQQVEEIIEPGQQGPSEGFPFTPRSKKVLELSLREALQLGQHDIGTEHILLGLIREGDGVAAQVLVKMGAELNRVRQQVIELISGQPPQPGYRPLRKGVPAMEGQAGLDLIEGRLAAVERRLGTGPDTGDLDRELGQVRQDKVVALGREDYEDATVLRDRERDLLAQLAERQEKWTAAHPDLASLAERVQQLSDEIERLRAVIRQHGIGPEDKPA